MTDENKTDLTSFIAGKISSSGRKGLRRDWSTLVKLCEERVFPHLKEKDVEDLLGKTLALIDPELNDYKALAAYGASAGWVNPHDVRDALRHADESNQFWFLASHSGKTFGEKIAPLIAEYYLKRGRDAWHKMPTSALYDFEWSSGKRIIHPELKASSEKQPRFQQIRHPKMSEKTEYDYDSLLCLGVYGGALEWWHIPAPDVEMLMRTDVIIQQHNAHKNTRTESYWMIVTPSVRKLLTKFYIGDSRKLRARMLK